MTIYWTFHINQSLGELLAPDHEGDRQDEKRHFSASKGCFWAITAVIVFFMMPVFVLLAASVTDRVAAAIIGKTTTGIGIFAMVAINVNNLRMVTVPLLIILLVAMRA